MNFLDYNDEGFFVVPLASIKAHGLSVSLSMSVYAHVCVCMCFHHQTDLFDFLLPDVHLVFRQQGPF